MLIAITNPQGDDSPVGVKMGVLLKATGATNIDWTAAVNADPPASFASGTGVVYTTPVKVLKKDLAGPNLGVDVITITATDTGRGRTNTTTLLLVQGVPRISETVIARAHGITIAEKVPEPVYSPRPGGLADPPNLNPEPADRPGLPVQRPACPRGHGGVRVSGRLAGHRLLRRERGRRRWRWIAEREQLRRWWRGSERTGDCDCVPVMRRLYTKSETTSSVSGSAREHGGLLP